jgi:serpin B
MKVQRVLVLAATAVALLPLVGCNTTVSNKGFLGRPNASARMDTPAPPDTRKPVPIRDLKSAKALAAQNNAFAFKMVGALGLANSKKNEVISPASLGLCLSMLYNGLEGESAKGLAKALQLNGMSLEKLNQANADLMTRLKGNTGVEFGVANGVWVKVVTLQRAYVDAMAKDYAAKVEPMPSDAKPINDWVMKNTRNRIKGILDQLDPQTLVMLINAVTFDGKWDRPFKHHDTQNRPFQGHGGVRQVDMMSMHLEYFECANDHGAKAIALPYRGGLYKMVLALPAKGKPVSSILNQTAWTRLTRKLKGDTANVQIPRFFFETSYGLIPPLRKLGAGALFSPSNDFGRMAVGGERLSVTDAQHKAYIKVDEEGTEAAAVTEVAMTMDIVENPFEFVADRPFVFAIVENATGQILFIGVVNQPTRDGGN